eukprot:963315-Amphidinium_carterae.1
MTAQDREAKHNSELAQREGDIEAHADASTKKANVRTASKQTCNWSLNELYRIAQYYRRLHLFYILLFSNIMTLIPETCA